MLSSRGRSLPHMDICFVELAISVPLRTPSSLANLWGVADVSIQCSFQSYLNYFLRPQKAKLVFVLSASPRAFTSLDMRTVV